MILIIFLLIGLLIGLFVGQQWIYSKNLGEALVANRLEQLRGLHVLVNNVTLPTEDGTTQIDHILLTETGIFIIETKHYSGWIFGDPHNAKWTQVIYKMKNRFKNPLHQNYLHIKTVQSLFKLPESIYTGIAVFTGSAEFKTKLGPNVLYLNQLLSFIEQPHEKVLDERQMAYIVGRIEMKRLPRSRETDEYHQNYVRSKIRRRTH